MGARASLDPRPGGHFRLEYRLGEVTSGEYIAVESPSRVAFTWGWEQNGDPTPPGSSLVEVTLEPDGDGTRLRLTHTRLSQESVAPHGEGWTLFLGRLADRISAPRPA